MDARLLIAEGDLRGAQSRLEAVSKGAPDSATQGERAGLLAVVMAALGESQAAQRHASLARATTHATEARFLSSFADQIIEVRRHERTDALVALIQTASDADYTDGFVAAYRAFPPLLRLATQDAMATQIVSNVVRSAADQRLAKKMGIRVVPDPTQPGHPLLTPRELEVLELLGLGLANGEIAQRLFIAESTVKVHVRHVLEKLGAKNRLQAALMAQRDAV
jgi:DNA-binding NarL/FixJ family response regulator